MARQEKIELVIPDAAGPGTPSIVDRHRDKTILITVANLGGGTLNILGSMDGFAFFQIGSTIAAAGFIAISETLKSIRIDRVTNSSVGEVADLLAFDDRTQ